jgi:hypothetical protein
MNDPPNPFSAKH